MGESGRKREQDQIRDMKNHMHEKEDLDVRKRGLIRVLKERREGRARRTRARATAATKGASLNA